MYTPIIAVVTRETRLQGLKARWATAQAAAFRMEQAVEHERAMRKARHFQLAERGGSGELYAAAAVDHAAEALAAPTQYADEDQIYQHQLKRLLRDLDFGFPVKTIDRTFLPNFDFGRCVLVVVIGQDGLVANAAKYVGDLPIIGVNPDPARNDGVLLPFEVSDARAIVRSTIRSKPKIRRVTLAEVNLNDGQKMLAFNDFFIGASSHVSARYTLEAGGRLEQQSSSGILVATGAGSTGWFSSVWNMTSGINKFLGMKRLKPISLEWEDRRLMWMVREPFRSKHSQADLVMGSVEQGDELVIGSQMPTGGVIFSDGVEADFLEFNAGSIARVKVSDQRANLVVG